jgi:hypothetical protein
VTPPSPRPYPRHVADASQDGRPYGRWEERLRDVFASVCEPLSSDVGSPLEPATLKWFPDRGWGGRVYVPVTGRASEPTATEDGEKVLPEYFGWVSFRSDDPNQEPEDLAAKAEFTDVTAEDNPEWRIDLNDDVLGRWTTDGGRGGDVTLIWGLPLVRGAVAATAELDGELLDQAPVNDGRFTLVATDAIQGFGDDLYVTVRLWDRRMQQVAAESLYADSGDDDADE